MSKGTSERTCRCGGRHRNRRLIASGQWHVQARVERFVEPALLLAISEGPTHGYELAEQLGEVAGLDVDYGNLYRLLRGLEEDGIVTSRWQNDPNARSKRTYELTAAGGRVLDKWIESLRDLNDRTAVFLRRHDQRRKK